MNNKSMGAPGHSAQEEGEQRLYALPAWKERHSLRTGSAALLPGRWLSPLKRVVVSPRNYTRLRNSNLRTRN